jgi:hypothetical protein
MSDALFGGLMLLAVLAAPAAFVCVISLYKKETARVGCLAYGLLLRVESKRVDEFENMSDEELRQYVYGFKELDCKQD